MNKCKIIDLGLADYSEARDLQKKIVQKKLSGKNPDTLLLCEHRPVITIGRKGGKDDLLVSEEFLKEKGIKIYYVERGGEATYHCPGQLVGYPIFNLRNFGMDLHKFLRDIEQVIIGVLSEIGIDAFRKEKFTGVWIKKKNSCAKIAFIGIGVKKWVTYHGFSLNIDCDLSPFKWIVPCGLKEMKVTTIKEVVRCSSFVVSECQSENIKKKIIENFEKVFELDYEKKTSAMA